MHYLSIVEHAFPDRPSGSARVAWDIALAMRESGHEVKLLCYWPDDSTISDADCVEGIEIVRFEKPTPGTWHPLRYHLMAAEAGRAAKRIHAKKPVSVVHVHTQVLGKGVVDVLIEQARIVTTIHSPVALEQQVNERGRSLNERLRLAVAGLIVTHMERQLLRDSSAIHTLSAFTRDRLIELHEIGMAEKVSVIPHWAKRPACTVEREAARSSLGWFQNQPILFTLRNLRLRYGIEVAIRAIAPLLAHHDAHFYVGGDGPLRSELEALSFDLGAGDRIHFLGRMADDLVELAYAAADLFVLPTVALECFGLIVLEALAHGCPIVSTDAAALPEVVGRVQPDSIVAAGDVAALRARVAAFLEGSLHVDPPETLIDKVFTAYDRDAIMPEIMSLLGG